MTFGQRPRPLSRSVAIKGEKESTLPSRLFCFFGYIFILFVCVCVCLKKKRTKFNSLFCTQKRFRSEA